MFGFGYYDCRITKRIQRFILRSFSVLFIFFISPALIALNKIYLYVMLLELVAKEWWKSEPWLRERTLTECMIRSWERLSTGTNLNNVYCPV